MKTAFSFAALVGIRAAPSTGRKHQLSSTQPVIRCVPKKGCIAVRASAGGGEDSENKKVTLTWLLVNQRVASKETCELMIKCGQVRVNGEIVREVKARVRRSDHILIQGKDLYGAPDDDDVRNLPNAQRDFGVVSRESSEGPTWRVDGGFLSRKSGGRFK